MNVRIKYKMLEYDRIDISEGIDIDIIGKSKECPYLCNRCHDLTQEPMSFNNVAIVSVKENNYRIYFWYMSKNDAIVLMTNSNLNDKNGIL